jgi:hypothetical protein
VKSTGRCIGLDVHREFAQVAIWQDGQVSQAGRFATAPEKVRAFADGLGPYDEVALEATKTRARSQRCWLAAPGDGVRALPRSGSQVALRDHTAGMAPCVTLVLRIGGARRGADLRCNHAGRILGKLEVLCAPARHRVVIGAQLDRSDVTKTVTRREATARAT